MLILRLHLLRRFAAICITRARFALDFADTRKCFYMCVRVCVFDYAVYCVYYRIAFILLLLFVHGRQ